MNNPNLNEKLDALNQLKQEKKNTCKVYDRCMECPNFLSGRYCEIELALKALSKEIERARNNRKEEKPM